MKLTDEQKKVVESLAQAAISSAYIEQNSPALVETVLLEANKDGMPIFVGIALLGEAMTCALLGDTYIRGIEEKKTPEEMRAHLDRRLDSLLRTLRARAYKHWNDPNFKNAAENQRPIIEKEIRKMREENNGETKYDA